MFMFYLFIYNRRVPLTECYVGNNKIPDNSLGKNDLVPISSNTYLIPTHSRKIATNNWLKLYLDEWQRKLSGRVQQTSPIRSILRTSHKSNPKTTALFSLEAPIPVIIQ